jgi:hypothetical protein
MFRSKNDRGRCGGIGAVGVQKRRHLQAELGEHMFADLRQDPFPGPNVATPHENGALAKILRPTCKDGAMHHIADVFRLNGAVAEYFVSAGIDGDDPIEHAGVGIAVQLNQDSPLVHS